MASVLPSLGLKPESPFGEGRIALGALGELALGAGLRLPESRIALTAWVAAAVLGTVAFGNH